MECKLWWANQNSGGVPQLAGEWREGSRQHSTGSVDEEEKKKRLGSPAAGGGVAKRKGKSWESESRVSNNQPSSCIPSFLPGKLFFFSFPPIGISSGKTILSPNYWDGRDQNCWFSDQGETFPNNISGKTDPLRVPWSLLSLRRQDPRPDRSQGEFATIFGPAKPLHMT